MVSEQKQTLILGLEWGEGEEGGGGKRETYPSPTHTKNKDREEYGAVFLLPPQGDLINPFSVEDGTVAAVLGR